jgi:hypothetical protein
MPTRSPFGATRTLLWVPPVVRRMLSLVDNSISNIGVQAHWSAVTYRLLPFALHAAGVAQQSHAGAQASFWPLSTSIRRKSTRGHWCCGRTARMQAMVLPSGLNKGADNSLKLSAPRMRCAPLSVSVSISRNAISSPDPRRGCNR